jgi:hypothetical protein
VLEQVSTKTEAWERIRTNAEKGKTILLFPKIQPTIIPAMDWQITKKENYFGSLFYNFTFRMF